MVAEIVESLTFAPRQGVRPGKSARVNPRPQDYCSGCGRIKWQLDSWPRKLCHVCRNIATKNATNWWKQFDAIEPGGVAAEIKGTCTECGKSVRGRLDKKYCSRLCLSRAFAKRKRKEYFKLAQRRQRGKSS
jgi:hypothetical protein